MQNANLIRAAVAAAALALAAPALAQAPRACPHEEGDLERISATLRSVSSCQVAFDLMNACRRNASSDVALADIVIKRCEQTFLAKLPPVGLRVYEDERSTCRRRYARREGTMYQSFSATCEAGVAARYARSAERRSRGR